jgi:OmpA-OmpF porin, OOP family
MRLCEFASWSTISMLYVLAIATRADAQEPAVRIDIRGYRPTLDPRAQLATEPVESVRALDINLQGIIHYAHAPVSLRSRDGTVVLRPLQHQLLMDLGANIGLGRSTAFGVSLPLVLLQSGSEALPAAVLSRSNVPSSAVGDLALQGKATFVHNETGGVGVAALGSVTLPTGTRESFAADASATVAARALVDYSLIIAGIQATLGYFYRVERSTWPSPSVGGVTYGDALPFSLGIWFRPSILKIDSENRQRWDLGIRGQLPIFPVGPFGLGEYGSAQRTQLVLAASDRFELGASRDLYLLGGAEVGLTSGVGVPTFRAVVGIGYSLRKHDRDDDGVEDSIDECPDVAEDRDGIEDSDGCPDIDDDEDGIVDTEDACPRKKGNRSTIRSENGCPPKDSDGDGIPDDRDACPSQLGTSSFDAQCNGCPVNDRDGDGIEDDNASKPQAPAAPPRTP